MGLILSAPSVSVTIGATAYPLAVVSGMTDSLAPEVDSCEIAVPWGTRKVSGSADPAETLPALGAAVVVTSGGYTWRGTLTARHRVANGRRRHLLLRAHGPGLAADRSYLPTFARATTSGVGQVAGGPRFAPGTRSSTADGPGATYRLGGSADWTVGQAIAAVIAHADKAGLPAITIDATGADLSRVLPDTDCDGLSYHATLAAILAHRMGLTWRLADTATGWGLYVRGTSGAGSAVDLTVGNCSGYDLGEDASATLADLEIRGARKQYVISVDAYTSGSGDLDPDWSAGDETDRAAGDLGSPAYRRFRLTTFALPDGSSSSTADPVPTLPISDATSLSAGSSPWLVFAQKTADSAWISLQGRISISVQGTTLWLEGIDPAEWSTWSRIRVTLCLSPRSHVATVQAGGSGMGRGLAIVGNRHAYASGAAVRVSGASLASVTGAVVTETAPVDDASAAMWASLGAPQWILTWTLEGVVSADLPPGTRLTSVILPVPGGAPTTVPIDCLVSSRSISWRNGRPVTTWSAVPRPFATGALTR